jgi:hypothetical protein
MNDTANELKAEVAMRLRHDAANGPGASERLYSAELARRISLMEKSAAKEVAGSGRELSTGPALSLGRLRGEGLSAVEKMCVLRVAAGRAAAAAPAPPAAAAPRVTPVALPIPTQTPAAPAHAPTAPVAVDPYPLSAEYASIEDPVDRTLFFRANKLALASEDRRRARAEAAVKPSKVPTASGSLIAQMESIGDPGARVAFYRKNKAAIDASFQRLNQNQ